ncbi:hypothetical protein G7054_g10187 [Neopestalotiopsis clavispora]|nr:hypothetical protein G7054_g10187 [Neopestalotiopsis clavispora]
MAVYGQNAMLFKSQELSDFTLTCHGTRIPAHRIILATHSPVFRRAMSIGFKETRESVMDFPVDDPAILEKLVSIMYRGSYDDIIFGNVTAPHIATTMPLDKVHSSANGRGNGNLYENDERDAAAIAKWSRDHMMNHRLEDLEAKDVVFECMQDALYIYIMARRLQCDIATVVAHDRFNEILEFYFDMEEYHYLDLKKFTEFIDELYTNTPPDVNIRRSLCNQIKQFQRIQPEPAAKLRTLAADVLEVHPDFRKDMNRS